jgi:hypothetical protein
MNEVSYEFIGWLSGWAKIAILNGQYETPADEPVK